MSSLAEQGKEQGHRHPRAQQKRHFRPLARAPVASFWKPLPAVHLPWASLALPPRLDFPSFQA